MELAELDLITRMTDHSVKVCNEYWCFTVVHHVQIQYSPED